MKKSYTLRQIKMETQFFNIYGSQQSSSKGGGAFTVALAYLKKQEKSQVNNLT